MKFVVLLESSKDELSEIETVLKDKESCFINTETEDETHEYKRLINSIREFSQSNKQVLVAKISGRERIINTLGDDCPEMIIPLSKNRESKHYTESPVGTFLQLLSIFQTV
jgi:hypothetical protein